MKLSTASGTRAGTFPCAFALSLLRVVSLAVVLVHAFAASAATFVVNEPSDEPDANPGDGLAEIDGAPGRATLRAALQEALAAPGADTITFSVNTRILLATPLPAITEPGGPVTLDGGGDVIIDGFAMSTSAPLLTVVSGGNTLRGLTLLNGPNDGVVLRTAAAFGNRIEQCRIGFADAMGEGNQRHGIQLKEGAHDNTLLGNVIGGNGGSGLVLSGGGTTNNEISANSIGFDSDSGKVIGNAQDGVVLNDGASQNIIHDGNVIVRNRNGLLLTGETALGNVILGNFVGTDEEGRRDLGNFLDGIALRLGVSQTRIGAPDAGNVIAGNGRHGISMVYGADASIVQGNLIGITTASTPLRNARNGLLILESARTLVGGTEPGQGNQIAYNGEEGVAINGAPATGNSVRGNAIFANEGGGISLAEAGNGDVPAPELRSLLPVGGSAFPGALVDLFADDDLQGQSFLGAVTADAEGLFEFDVDLQPHLGRNLTATATDSDGNTSAFSAPLPVPGEGGEGEGECSAPCAAVEDSDGDGLTDCFEQCEYLTRPDSTDTDGDGLPDNFEVQYAPTLDPLQADDALEDADGDALSNLEEFLRRSSPIDPGDPDALLFVAPPPLGLDAPERGTQDAPLATVVYAIEMAAPSSDAPARIMLLDGAYPGDFLIPPHTTLISAPGHEAVITGQITAAYPSQIMDLTLQARLPEQLLIQTDVAGDADATLTLSGLLFTGSGMPGVTGLRLLNNEANTIVESCTFDALETGIQCEGAVPLVRRCTFENISGAAVHLLDTGRSSGSKSLGDTADAESGWNAFQLSTFTGAAVVNERSEAVKAERNAWDTASAAEINATLEGPVDFEPFLITGASTPLLAGAVYCTVWDAAGQTTIENASVELEDSGYPPLTEGEQGVYAFPVLAGGAYTLIASAPGYATQSHALDVGDGETLSPVLALVALGGEGEGEGEGEAPPECCRRLRAGGSDFPGGGDLLLAAVIAIVCTAATPRRSA